MIRVHSNQRGSTIEPRIILANKVRSAQVRTHDIDKLLMDDNILYLDEDKNRTDDWFQAIGHDVPFGGTKYGSIRMIHLFLIPSSQVRANLAKSMHPRSRRRSSSPCRTNARPP